MKIDGLMYCLSPCQAHRQAVGAPKPSRTKSAGSGTPCHGVTVMGKDAGPAKKGGKTIEKTKVTAAKGESSTGVAERAGDAHGNEPVEPMAATEAGALQELGEKQAGRVRHGFYARSR